MDRLVDVILDLSVVSANLFHVFNSFRTELHSGGDNQDDQRVFQLFGKPVAVLKRGRYVSGGETCACIEEFITFLVAARGQQMLREAVVP